MLNAMMRAQVGDDVFGEDPTINELEYLSASIFGMEAGLFCPSGTMTNQIAIKVHTQPANEVICDKTSHVYMYEGGGIAFNSGCQVRTLDGDRGKITAAQVADAINPDDVHKPVSSLVTLENTANRGGGSCYEIDEMAAIQAVCKERNLALHLDGARVFNAIVAKSQDPFAYGKIFDSISICLSKGLGAPVGSVLLGTKDFIRQARRVRKVLGGGMRQGGYLAAAGLFALKTNVQRLEIDHIHAKQLAEALLKKEFVGKMLPVETNILIFEIKGSYTAAGFVEQLAKHDIRCIAISPTQVRMVTHLDVTEDMIHHTLDTIAAL
jgi:threonine aldolase